jgi:protein gp37
MAENSAIEWCDHTFNPVVGCTKLSPACDFCYAEQWARRTGQSALWNGERRRTTPANWRQPLKWQANAKNFMDEHGRRQRVFCASLADVFDNQWDQKWRMDLYALIGMTPDLDWLLLTKRPQNIAEMFPASAPGVPFFPNVWLGTTTENQEEANRRIPHLLAIPAVVHFLSCEPLLGPIDFRKVPGFNRVGLDLSGWWIIAGGESGPNARPMHPDWVRGLRDQCITAGVPFFFKQWGEWAPFSNLGGRFPSGRSNDFGGCKSADEVYRVGKKAAGHLLDGHEWRQFPEVQR